MTAEIIDFKQAHDAVRRYSEPGSFCPHPIHGPNETAVICYWCARATGERAMLGAGYNGKAPPAMAVDYRFCLQCQDEARGGLWCVEVMPSRTSNLPEIALGVSPTGKKLQLSRRAFISLPVPDMFKSEVLNSGLLLVPTEVFETIERRQQKENP